MHSRMKRFIKLYPWHSGFTADLLFYIAIDTLFLTQVKNFSPAQIVSITSFSQFACIALQFPVLFIIKRIGNTSSVRVGSLSLLLSSILITFGKSYYLVLLGRLFHDIAVIFRNLGTKTPKNIHHGLISLSAVPVESGNCYSFAQGSCAKEKRTV